MIKLFSFHKWSSAFWACLVLVAVQDAYANAALVIAKGEGAGQVRITATNSSNSACGAEINLGDGKTQKKRLEPKEQWQLEHAYSADGKFTVTLSGVFVTRGLRSVTACELQQEVVVNVSGGQATASASPSPAPSTTSVPALHQVRLLRPLRARSVKWHRLASQLILFFSTAKTLTKCDLSPRLMEPRN